jgi:transposase
MSRPRKYPDELIQRGARLAVESGRPVRHVADDLGIHHETLRRRVRQAEVGRGLRPDLPRRRSGRRSSGCARKCLSYGARTRS